MIKAVVAGMDKNLAQALEEYGKCLGVEVIASNVVVPKNIYAETTNFFDAYADALHSAFAAVRAVPDGNIFAGRKSILRRINGEWYHQIGVQIVNRFEILLCGTWTEAISVPRNLVDMVRSNGMTVYNLERVLSDFYSQKSVDPYCWISYGRTRQQLMVEALSKVPNYRWLIDQ
jgi:hypothetical protein